MKNRLVRQGLMLCASFLLLWAPQTLAHSKLHPFPPEAPEGPFQMTVNVFFDSARPPKMSEVRESLAASAELLKANLNLEVHWRYAGKLKGLLYWRPAKEDELSAKFKKYKKADASLIFTNRYWDEDFWHYSPHGLLIVEHKTYAGFCVPEAKTMVVYESSEDAKVKAPDLDCSLNTVVIQHEFGHLLGLEHDDDDASSIMFPTCNRSGAIWHKIDINFARWQLFLRGYQK